MDIGTAKVSAADRARVPHHGLDLVDPDEPFTAADYLAAAMAALRDIGARGGVAILVGGTGLYLRAVARGVPLDATGHDPETRAEIEQRLETDGLGALVARAEGARAQRGRGDGPCQPSPRRPRPGASAAARRRSATADRAAIPRHRCGSACRAEPEVHRRWIAERARAQFAAGLIDEAAALRQRYDPTLRAFSAVGYREAFDVLDGRITLDEAIAQDIVRNNQFARRQRTWFRAEPDIHWLAADSTTP